MYCAGALAQLYEELGGPVDYAGKPYPAVYRRARELLAELAGHAIADDDILAIGDGVHTDIEGAAAAGARRDAGRPAAGPGSHRRLRRAARRRPRLCLATAAGRHAHRPGRVRRHAARLSLQPDAATRRPPRRQRDRRCAARGADPAGEVEQPA